MSTESNSAELSPEQLATVSGGEDGGFRHQNPGIGPKKGIFSESGDNSLDDELSPEQLATVSGGEDGGFRHQNPGIGPTEGLIK
jgi:hypothetical protein